MAPTRSAPSAVTQIKGSLFDAPSGSILLNSCNCQGVWGTGIASQLRERFPAACDEYAEHCDVKDKSSLLGTTLLVEAGDYEIACLFTSVKYGRFKDPPQKILDSTRAAVKDLIRQVQERDAASDSTSEFAAVKLNAGAFAVRWERTKAVLEELFGEAGLAVTVYDK